VAGGAQRGVGGDESRLNYLDAGCSGLARRSMGMEKEQERKGGKCGATVAGKSPRRGRATLKDEFKETMLARHVKRTVARGGEILMAEESLERVQLTEKSEELCRRGWGGEALQEGAFNGQLRQEARENKGQRERLGRVSNIPEKE